MIHPIPPGTRDVLPDEMRELRRLHLALIDVFESRGYGEVATPAIKYDEVLARGDGRTADSAYRCFDERGDLLALRSDMTVPIARLVASRYANAEPPLRLCYLANAFRAAESGRPGASMRMSSEPTASTSPTAPPSASTLPATGVGMSTVALSVMTAATT